MQTAAELNLIIKEALLNTYRNHQELGVRGLEKLRGNQFGETSLRGDWEAEEIVIQALKEHKVPIKILSEEHGIVSLGNELLGTLDGLDGTNRYIARMDGDTTACYGTMVSIFEGTNPRYKDYIAAGIMMHPTGKLFTASKGNGVFVLDVTSGETSPVKAPKIKASDTPRIIVDNYESAQHHEFLQQYVMKIGQPFDNLNSTAAHYVELVSGNADLILECTRKGNLELPCGYALLSERKGNVFTLDMKSIGDQRYLKFHREPRDYVPLVLAANFDMAERFIRKIR